MVSGVVDGRAGVVWLPVEGYFGGVGGLRRGGWCGGFVGHCEKNVWVYRKGRIGYLRFDALGMIMIVLNQGYIWGGVKRSRFNSNF